MKVSAYRRKSSTLSKRGSLSQSVAAAISAANLSIRRCITAWRIAANLSGVMGSGIVDSVIHYDHNIMI
jgi:hypothetical protein